MLKMNQIKEEKLQFKNTRKMSQLPYSFIIHSLMILTCTSLFYYPYWFPSICSSMKHLCFIFLPKISSSFFNPKCLFIVVNVIVAFLLGESKLLSPHSAPADEIYNEYCKTRRSTEKVPGLGAQENREEKLPKIGFSEKSVPVDNDKGERKSMTKASSAAKVMKEVKRGAEDVARDKESDDGRDEDGEEEEEEECGLPAEELTKRAEEFIARVNRQRLLEARSLVCLKA